MVSVLSCGLNHSGTDGKLPAQRSFREEGSKKEMLLVRIVGCPFRYKYGHYWQEGRVAATNRSKAVAIQW